jgi:glycyl-tRNA synthetase
MKWFEYWKKVRLAWHEALGMGNENYRYHDHEKLAHYANAATDIEFKMPFGFKEVEGIHSRTNFDLSQHEKYSGRSIKYFDPEKNESYVPYDVETSIGVDRMFLSVMCHSYCEEKLENGETRVVLRLPEALAPVKCAVFPLDKKYGLPELAHEIVDELKFHFNTHYGDPKDSIGKRYRRQDAIGTPFCITVDHETPNDHKVTLRYRDTMEQERVAISDLRSIIEERVSITSVLKKLGKEIKNF